MGCMPKPSSSSYEYRPSAKALPNPNPLNYHIYSYFETPEYLLLMVIYPDCNNFEGKKLLLFKGVTLKQIQNQKPLDPHFSNSKEFFSPVARFEPSDEGFLLAARCMGIKL